MEITTGMEIVETALWLKKEKTLIISDLHVGYEEALQQQGMMVPKFQLEEILQKLREIFKRVTPARIVINGDLKHEFGRVLRQEWKEVLQLIDFLLEHGHELIIVKGNHDMIIGPLAKRRNINVVKDLAIGDTAIFHGDELHNTKAKRIIIGHEHPAITLREKSKREKYKCFLKGKWKRKELIAMPSFNPLTEGTDVLKEQLLSPYLQKLDDFEVFIVSKGEVFAFGKVKGLRRKEE
ncbi:metallophosphoesterase [Candidatus Woesearchaeota archaeon]|nr:metallophosphoesterase [Candidatus Woesearchaeota archaeon]